jgi:thiol:disulfide interchange protein DsbD
MFAGAAVVSAIILAVAPRSLGQSLLSQPGSLVETGGYASLTVFHPGSRGFVAVAATITEPWHINSHEPIDEYLIPTELEITAPEGITVEGILYPDPEMIKLEISETTMPLYHGTMYFGAIIEISDEIEPGEYSLRAVLSYQGCNDMTCLEPASVVEEIPIKVGTERDLAEIAHEEIFSAPPFVDGGGRPVTGAADEESSFGELLEQNGLILAFIFIYLGGLALNLTPCVYPLIPITVSYFGGQAGGRSSRTFVLALFYVLGMSITYSVLGTIAATTGGLFGSALQNPWVILFIAVVLVGLAASMFGLWEFRLPVFLSRRSGRAKQGRWGALVMGLTVGIVAAPCIGPFVLGLLTYVGETGKPALGFMMFFTLAWGMGTPFIVLGTLSGSISRLPQSGHWMVWVRKIFGFILIMMAIYFARHILGPAVTYTGYAVTAAAAGLMLWPFDRTPQKGRAFYAVKTLVGAAWLIAAAALLASRGGPFRAAPDTGGIEWEPFSEERLAAASDEGRPVIIDFSADWCTPCRELEHKTFRDEAVAEYSEDFVRLKMDLTTIDADERRIKRDFGIRGVPTIIFLDPSGSEAEGSRIIGFIEPEKLLERMRGVYRKE